MSVRMGRLEPPLHSSLSLYFPKRQITYEAFGQESNQVTRRYYSLVIDSALPFEAKRAEYVCSIPKTDDLTQFIPFFHVHDLPSVGAFSLRLQRLEVI